MFRNDWKEVLSEEIKKPYFTKLQEYIQQRYDKANVYPKKTDIFNAFHYTSYSLTNVVILGQDPYHGPNQAHGLSFSVLPEVKFPPSLRNIFKELRADVGCPLPSNGCLRFWADQGVLLLNTVLTVEEGQPNSHRGVGWETFTDQVIRLLNERERPIVFVLWGKFAQQKKKLITGRQHFIIEAPHPSPLSARRGFFGSRPFSKINDLLLQNGVKKINWNISEQEE